MDTDKLIEFLDKLGARIQGPAEHVWQIAVKQQYITAITGLIILAILLALTLIGWRKMFEVIDKSNTPERRYNFDTKEYEADDSGRHIYKVFASVIFAMLFVVELGFIQSNIILLLNPEYKALVDLIGRIK